MIFMFLFSLEQARAAKGLCCFDEFQITETVTLSDTDYKRMYFLSDQLLNILRVFSKSVGTFVLMTEVTQ